MTSPQIIGIGACVFDTLITLPSFPKEDSKTAAHSVKQAGGGPVATALVAAAKLGMTAGFAGLLAEDNGGQFLLEDFRRRGVSTDLVRTKGGARSFSSTVLLSRETASRTCLLDRGDLPAFSLDRAQREALARAELLMIDGNELSAAAEACRIVRENGGAVLYDCGGLYPGVEQLLALTDLMIPSEEFALGHTKKSTVREAAAELFARYRPKLVVVTCGKAGGLGYDGKEFFDYQAFPVAAQDTNGAGDVFHGAFAAGFLRGFDPRHCCLYASAVSALKCTGLGARDSIPDHKEVLAFLEERGLDPDEYL